MTSVVSHGYVTYVLPLPSEDATGSLSAGASLSLYEKSRLNPSGVPSDETFGDLEGSGVLHCFVLQDSVRVSGEDALGPPPA